MRHPSLSDFDVVFRVVQSSRVLLSSLNIDGWSKLKSSLPNDGRSASADHHVRLIKPLCVTRTRKQDKALQAQTLSVPPKKHHNGQITETPALTLILVHQQALSRDSCQWVVFILEAIDSCWVQTIGVCLFSNIHVLPDLIGADTNSYVEFTSHIPVIHASLWRT